MQQHENWFSFKNSFKQDVMPIYRKHEQEFDPYSIHGRLHICRALIFAEAMTAYYQESGIEVDAFAIRYAVSFHDAGRLANGRDFWEEQSAELCKSYIEKKLDNSHYAGYIGNLISKQGERDLNKRIVHDADILEIMRPCCGHGGIDGFHQRKLNFLGERDLHCSDQYKLADIRECLVKEAWDLILASENNKVELLRSENLLEQIVELVASSSRYIVLKMGINHLMT